MIICTGEIFFELWCSIWCNLYSAVLLTIDYRWFEANRIITSSKFLQFNIQTMVIKELFYGIYTLLTVCFEKAYHFSLGTGQYRSLSSINSMLHPYLLKFYILGCWLRKIIKKKISHFISLLEKTKLSSIS